MKGLAYINNNAKFNSGTEFNDDLDIALYETPFRNYNAQIGRFQGIDKLSELTPSLTPMQFGGNNPISFNDPSGLACADAPMIGGPLEDATVYGTIGGGGSAAWSRSSYLVFLEIMNSYYGSIAESNGGSGSDGRPDGWVPDGDSYKYVNDKTKGVKEKVFIDPATGKTMHGDENGNLVAVPQELMDAMVSGTRHSNNFLNWPSIRPGQSFWNMEMHARIRDGRPLSQAGDPSWLGGQRAFHLRSYQAEQDYRIMSYGAVAAIFAPAAIEIVPELYSVAKDGANLSVKLAQEIEKRWLNFGIDANAETRIFLSDYMKNAPDLRRLGKDMWQYYKYLEFPQKN